MLLATARELSNPEDYSERQENDRLAGGRTRVDIFLQKLDQGENGDAEGDH